MRQGALIVVLCGLSLAGSFAAEDAQRTELVSPAKKAAKEESARPTAVATADKKPVAVVAKKDAPSLEIDLGAKSDAGQPAKKNAADKKDASTIAKKDLSPAEKKDADTADKKAVSSVTKKDVVVTVGKKEAGEPAKKDVSANDKKELTATGKKDVIPAAKKDDVVAKKTGNDKKELSVAKKDVDQPETKEAAVPDKKAASSTAKKDETAVAKKEPNKPEKKETAATDKKAAGSKKDESTLAKKEAAQPAKKEASANARKEISALAKTEPSQPEKKDKSVTERNANAGLTEVAALPKREASPKPFTFKNEKGETVSAEVVDQYQKDRIVYPMAKVDHRVNEKLIRAASIAQDRAHAHSKSACWHYVKNALVASGIISTYPKSVYAKQAGDELVRDFGFKKLPIHDPYQAPIGAVLVYGSRRAAGHVELRTKTGFVSDFQNKKPSKRPLIGVYAKA